MTQAQLDRTVARRTGDSLRTVRRVGFRARSGPSHDLEPEDLHLAVDCPFCGAGSRLPALPTGLAECDRCDVESDHDPEDVYASGPAVSARDGVAA
jgi:hypothetical protein